MRCLHCGKTYNKLSEEHIIPNALYGHLKSKVIMCEKCNVKFSDIDAIFEKHYKPLLIILNTKKDRKKSKKAKKSITVEIMGVEATYDEAGGLSSIAKPVIQDGQLHTTILFNEHTKEMVLKESKDRLLGALQKQSKMTESELNKLIDQAFCTSSPLNKFIYFPEIQLVDNSLGVLKIAVNFYLLYTKDNIHIKNAIDILHSKDEQAAKKLVSWFQVDVSLLNSATHLIRLVGCNKKLYCLVSLFGIENRYVLLSDNYTGEEIDKSYCYDLIHGNEIEKSLDCTEIITNWPENFPELFKCVFGYIYDHNTISFMVTNARELSQKKIFYSFEEYENEYSKKCNIDFFQRIKGMMPVFYDTYLYIKANEHCHKVAYQLHNILSSYYSLDDKIDDFLLILVKGNKEEIASYITSKFFHELPNSLIEYIQKNEELNNKISKIADDTANASIIARQRSFLNWLIP